MENESFTNFWFVGSKNWFVIHNSQTFNSNTEFHNSIEDWVFTTTYQLQKSTWKNDCILSPHVILHGHIHTTFEENKLNTAWNADVYYSTLLVKLSPSSHSLFFLFYSLKEKVLSFKTVSIQVSSGTDLGWDFGAKRPKKHLYVFQTIKQLAMALQKNYSHSLRNYTSS